MIRRINGRSIVRWIHILLSIPIAGYVYGQPSEVAQYADGVRYLFFPAITFTGLWMWKGHFLRQLILRRVAE